MIISLSGNDGSGKTTIGKMLKKHLEKSGFTVEYRQEFDYFVIKYLLKLVPKSFLQKKRDSFQKPTGKTDKEKEKQTERGGIFLRIWAYFVYLDQIVEYLYLKISKRNKLVITDRFAFDFYMSFQYLNCLDPISRFLFKHFPKPDISFVLEVEPKIAHSRKDDTHHYPFSFYVKQRKRYMEFAKYRNIPCVNTNNKPKATLNTLLEGIQNRLFQHSEKLFSRVLHHIAIGKKLTKKDLKLAKNKDFLDIAVRNDLVPQAAKAFQTKELEHIQKTMWKRFCESYRFMMKHFKKHKIDTIIFKTLPRGYDVCPTDVDVIVPKKDRKKAQKILREAYNNEKIPSLHKAVTYENKNEVPIDLHHEISWLGNRVIDLKHLWDNKKKYSIGKDHFHVPCAEDEILIVIAHSLFQHHYTTLGEFLFIHSLLTSEKNIDFTYMEKQASKYGWGSHLMCLIKAVNQKAGLLGLQTIQLPQQFDAYPSISPKKLMRPVFHHKLSMVPRANKSQKVDYFINFYRIARYHWNGVLPYNENWTLTYDF